MADRQIVAVGGGDPGPVFDYVLGLVRSAPKLLWVGTAGAEDPWNALTVYDRFHGRGVFDEAAAIGAKKAVRCPITSCARYHARAAAIADLQDRHGERAECLHPDHGRVA